MAGASAGTQLTQAGQGGVLSTTVASHALSSADSQQQVIIVKHEQVVVYDNNPRLTLNEKFDEIKASIKARKLDQLLTVTRRPGESHYLLCAGGGTRHQAITELINETGDRQTWGVYPVIFKPWVSEIDIMMAHATENLLRSPLNFFEQAMQEQKLRAQLILEDHTFATASLRQRRACYDQLGYCVSPTYLSHFDYIFNWLHPVLEQALLAGMGHRTVASIRSIDTTQRKRYNALRTSSAVEFDTLYRAALHTSGQADGEFDLSRFQDDLTQRVGSVINASPAPTLSEPGARPSDPQAQDSTAHSSGAAASRKAVVEQTLTGSRDDRLCTCRAQAEQIAVSLAHDYGLLRGAYYALSDMALGFGIENPDAQALITGDTHTDLDAVLVLLELHTLFWSLRDAEVRSGRLKPNHAGLQAISEHSHPGAITSSDTLGAIPRDRLLWRLSELRLQAAIARSQNQSSPARALIERLDQLRALADQYAITLFVST